MSAEIIQFVPRPNPKRDADPGPMTMELMAIDIFTMLMLPDDTAHHPNTHEYTPPKDTA